MRLPRISSDGAPDSAPAHADAAAGPARYGAHALLGAWLATRWQYTSRDDAARSLDVVCDLGASVTLSLSEGTYVLTHDVPGRGSRSLGGTIEMGAEALVMRARDAASPETVRFRLADHTLSLSSETSFWDFDGAGEQPARFVAVLVRL